MSSGSGLAGMVVLGWRLDLMILEVFSNLWVYDFLSVSVVLYSRRFVLFLQQ